jgi:hypothetical protein
VHHQHRARGISRADSNAQGPTISSADGHDLGLRHHRSCPSIDVAGESHAERAYRRGFHPWSIATAQRHTPRRYARCCAAAFHAEGHSQARAPSVPDRALRASPASVLLPWSRQRRDPTLAGTSESASGALVASPNPDCLLLRGIGVRRLTIATTSAAPASARYEGGPGVKSPSGCCQGADTFSLLLAR